jgi:hypothetical protein
VAGAQSADAPECQKADVWVAAHKTNLPDTLEALAPFTPTWRSRIFNALPVETKSALWVEHLTQAYSRPLTPAQKALVDEAIATLTPDFYRDHQRVPDGLRTQIAAGFKEDDAVDIFESLGPAVGGERLPSCNCADNRDCHAPNPVCANPSCTPTASGCGVGGGGECDFHCRAH